MTDSPQNPYQPAPTFIINNSSSASAAASVGLHGRRRRQSFWAHVVLFLFTAGLGNIVYAVHVNNWNSRNGF